MLSVSSKTSIAMRMMFSNICSLNKLPIGPLFLFKSSSSRSFPIISSPNTRNAGLILEHNFSGIPTNKIGHHFARNHGYAGKGRNEFSPYVPNHIDYHAPDDLQLRNGHHPEKVLALITALLGLFVSDQPQQSLGLKSNNDPEETLSQLAVLLGLSTHDTHAGTPKRLRRNGKEEGNSQGSKRQKTIANSDDPENGILPSSNTPPSQLYQTNWPSSQLSLTDDTDSRSNNSTLSHVDSFLILRRQLYAYPQVQGAFDSIKATLYPILLQRLKTVRLQNVTVKSGLETAASIDLLRLFGASSNELDEIGKRALEGARLLEEGHNKVINGKGMLECAFADIPNHLEAENNF